MAASPEDKSVVVVRTRVANLASVLAALKRGGAAPQMTEAAADVRAASHVVLPGVGSFGAGMAQLQRMDGMVEALRERIIAGRPTLCVCVGMQLLSEGSEESPGVQGLGILPATVQRFDSGTGVQIPQLGWNRVTVAAADEAASACGTAGEGDGDAHLLRSGYAYYANSFRLPADTALPTGWRVATTDHGGPFIAALEKGAVLGCQFHPELSGQWGQALLNRWLGSDLDRRATGGALC